MKNFIVALEVSSIREKAEVVQDFETLEQAEDYMITTQPLSKDEVVVLKRQDRNQWWAWDQETGQGWLPMTNRGVVLSAAALEIQREAAQVHISAAAAIEADMKNHPTGDVNNALRTAYAAEHRAEAMLLLAKADRRHLEVVLEAHGNVEWPMIS